MVREVLRNPRLCGYRARIVTEHHEDTGRAHQYRQIVRGHTEWTYYHLTQKRATIEGQLHAIIVHPAGRGRHAYNPDLLQPIWNEQ